MKERVPWWARIGAKVVLSRLPVSHGMWQRLHLFSPGAMDQPDYALRVFMRHFARTGLTPGCEFVALELGPGNSLSSAVIAAAHGATHTHLVDAGSFATADMAVYRTMGRQLRERGLTPPDLERVRNMGDLLTACDATYWTRGLNSLRDIPTASVDIAWSQAVLEHVRRGEFADIVRELRRIMKPGGFSSHVVDLKDHLGGALNNMRIPSRFWEADWMARSGFYTNRLRMHEMLDVFRHAGFSAHLEAVERWQSAPIPQRSLAREFQFLPHEEFLVKEFDVTLRPV